MDGSDAGAGGGMGATAFGGVRESSRYSRDLGGSMLLVNGNRDRPFSKIPTRVGKPYYGKRTAFTDSVFADRVALQPKAPPSRSATHMPQVKQRMREVKAQLREERARKHAARTARKELEHKWDSHVQSRNQLVVTTELAGPAASTVPRPKGTRNGQPYYGRVWCDENKTNEVERLRPVRSVGVDQMFTVMHRS